MSSEKPASRLSQISTSWTQLFAAHDPTAAMRAARRRLFERYEAPVRSYLLGALRDEEAAEECFQEFALRLLRGDFKRADPKLGSFRKYLKTALLNMVRDHEQKERRRSRFLSTDEPGATIQDPLAEDTGREFDTNLRDEMVGRALKALERSDGQTGQHLHRVLQLRIDHPEMTSEQMAEHLAPIQGKPLTAQWVRKRLFNARRRFAELLLDDVATSLEFPTVESLEEELIDLGLFEYCRSLVRERYGTVDQAGT